jgi:hypothetical protein
MLRNLIDEQPLEEEEEEKEYRHDWMHLAD